MKTYRLRSLFAPLLLLAGLQCGSGSSGAGAPGDGGIPGTTGNAKWSRGIPGILQESSAHIATPIIARGAAGDVFIAGGFRGTVQFGSTSLVASTTGQDAVFVMRIGPSGDILWAKKLEGTIVPAAIATDSSGAVIVAGTAGGTSDFGGGTVVLPSGASTPFLLKLDANGQSVLVRTYPPKSDNVRFSALAVAPNGDFLLGGNGGDLGNLDFGGGAVLAPPAGILTFAFLVRLNANGDGVWARSFSGTASKGQGCFQLIAAVRVDSADNVYFSGTHTNTSLEVGGNLLPAAAADTTMLYAGEASGTGAPLWLRDLVPVGGDYASGYAPSGALLFCSNSQVPVTFAGVTSDNYRLLCARVDPAGKDSGAVVLTDGGGFLTSAIAMDDHGNGFVAGTVGYKTTLGTFPITAVQKGGITGPPDVVLFRLSADNKLAWVRQYGDTGADYATGLALGAQDLTMVGLTDGNIDFGNGALLGESTGALWVADFQL